MTILGRLYVDKREEQCACAGHQSAGVTPACCATPTASSATSARTSCRSSSARPRLLNVVDFEKLSTADLIAEIKRLHDRFVFDTHVAVDVVNIAAWFFLDRARKVLSADGDRPVEPARPHPGDARGPCDRRNQSAAPGKSRRWLLLKNFGHRAVLDYELAEPRYAEDLNTLNRMIAGRVQAGRPSLPETRLRSPSRRPRSSTSRVASRR